MWDEAKKQFLWSSLGGNWLWVFLVIQAQFLDDQALKILWISLGKKLSETPSKGSKSTLGLGTESIALKTLLPVFHLQTKNKTNRK